MSYDNLSSVYQNVLKFYILVSCAHSNTSLFLFHMH